VVKLTINAIAAIALLILSQQSNAIPSAPILSSDTDGIQLSLNWSAVSSASGYKLYYAPSPYTGPESVEILELGNTTSIGGTLWADAAFFIGITAYDADGEGEISNVVQVEMTDENLFNDYMNSEHFDVTNWDEYEAVLDQIKSFYGILPTTINVSPTWFNSLQISPESFSSRTDHFQVEGTPDHGVGYGSFVNLPNNKKIVFYSTWEPQVPNSGIAFALEYENDEPKSIEYFPIEGSTFSWVLKNGNGTHSVVFMGVDEGKLHNGDQATSPTYFYDITSKTLTQSYYLTTSHNSILSDYDNDGDDDIVAQSWNEPFNGRNFILQNEGGNFNPIPLGENAYPYISGMGIGTLGYQEDGTFGVIIIDGSSKEWFGVQPEESFIAYLSSDLSKVEDIKPLPIPYFERSEYEEITQIIPGWEGNVGLSHDVAAKGIDLDYDGDLDIVISSMIWSDENPYTVLQILINDNGNYIDETDTRLHNWSLIGGGAHRLDFLDVNDDSYVDILVSDHGHPVGFHDWAIHGSILSGSRVLVNDGTGNLVTVIHQQINDSGDFLPSFVPSLNSRNELRWTVFNPNSTSQVEVRTRQLNMALSTGPNGIDSAKYGAPGFNEFYYLLHNEDVANAVSNGSYVSGLAHYLAYGRAEGRASNAREASN